MTTTEPTSLDALLDDTGTPAQEIAPAAPPETGDKQSAAPPADASHQDEPGDKDGPDVPRKALMDERQKRQELEKRLQELERSAQPQQRAPQQAQPQQQGITAEQLDELWFTNPAQAAAIVAQFAQRQAVVETEQRYLSRELNRSEKRARKDHGDEIVNAAWQHALRSGKGQAFIEEDDPYGALVEWYSGEKNALRAELMAEMGIQPGQQPAPPARTSAPVPKSLASRTSAAPRNPQNGQFESRASLEDLIG